MTIHQWRDAYAARGWFVHPIGPGMKSPYDTGWPDKTYAAEDFGDGANLGINLGRSGLADLDLDSPEVRALAGEYFTPTWRFGRVGSPDSHWVYACPESGAAHRKTWEDPTVVKGQPGRMLAELRVGRTQTMVAPSRHPSGEVVTWSAMPEPGPTVRTLTELTRDLGLVCSRVLLARHYAAEGTRDDFAMALAGALASAGWDGDEVSAFCVAVAEDAGDSDARARAKGHRTVQKFEAGEQVTGCSTLRKLIDPRVVDAVRGWLDLPKGEALPDEAAAVLAPEAATLRTQANQGLGWHERPAAEALAALKRTDLIGYNQTITRLKTEGVPNVKAIETNVAAIERERRKAAGETTGMVLGREGKPTACEANVAAVLTRIPGLTYDEFARRTLIHGRPVADSELMRLTIEIQTQHAIAASKTLVGSVVMDPPEGLFPRSHAVRDWLLALPPWDGVPRLEWLPMAFGVGEPEPIDVVYFRHFYLAAVRRVCGGGAQVKADDLLVLAGAGGLAKSEAIKVLMPARTWYTDVRVNISDPKSIIEQYSGKWIVELPELVAFQRKSDDEIKAFLSAESDKARKAYAHTEVEVGRQWIPIGTTNRDDTLAKFEGEDRRFAPVWCERAIDLQWLIVNREVLWAEALTGARTNEPHWIARGSEWWDAAEARRSTHRGLSDSAQLEIVYAWLEAGGAGRAEAGVTTREVLEGALQIVVPSAQDSDAVLLAGRLLREAGWTRKSRPRTGSRTRRYHPG